MTLYVTKEFVEACFGISRDTLDRWIKLDGIRTIRAQDGVITPRTGFRASKGKLVAGVNWDDIMRAANENPKRWKR